MSDEPEPDVVLREFVDAWNAGDADRIAGLFVDDADFVNVVGLWWRRREDIRRAHAYGFERIFRGTTMSLLQSRTRPVGDDVAVVHGRWQLVGQVGPDGEPGQRRRGVLVLVVRRAIEGWVAVAAQNTDRVEGADTWMAEPGGSRAVRYAAAPAGNREA